MHHYVAYGLKVRSAVPLPELTLVPAAGGAEAGDVVVVRLGPVSRMPTTLDAAGFGFWSDGDEACHVLDKVGAFLVRGGREIVVDAAPGVEDRVLRLSILGPALALLLHQRGLLVLHASVVARGSEALAVLGKNGWGKSTIAAALHAKGYDLVADDVAAIDIDRHGPRVLAGFPQVKLWPEAATLLGDRPETLPLLHPSFDKRGWRAARGFSLEPRRLEHVYVIAPGPTPAIEPLGPASGPVHRAGRSCLDRTTAPSRWIEEPPGPRRSRRRSTPTGHRALSRRGTRAIIVGPAAAGTPAGPLCLH
jgi:hypothetical protein